MKKNKKLLISIIAISVIGIISFQMLNKSMDKDNLVDDKKDVLALYVQNENGEYAASSAKAFPKEGYVLNLEKSTCKNGSSLFQDAVTKKINLKIQRNDQCSLYFDKEVPSLKEYYDKVTKKTEIPNFANPATTDETADGLFAMEDDYGTSYYFRGAVENNYLVFGRDSLDREMLWRIIRFNGDGSVRIQYDGFKDITAERFLRSFAIDLQSWNENQGDVKYAGWMYGGAANETSTSKEQAQRNETDSTIKMAVDNWYKENIIDDWLGIYIADSIFCNDRSTPGKSITNWTSDTGLGYAANAIGYGAVGRFMTGNNGTSLSAKTDPQPRFTCPQDNDKFSVSTENGGNGALTYPVGLITADEIVAAGSGKYNTTNEAYYLKKTRYWTMTPGHSFQHVGNPYIFTQDGKGILKSYVATATATINPVINIKTEYLDKFKGAGTLEDPYRLFVLEPLG